MIITREDPRKTLNKNMVIEKFPMGGGGCFSDYSFSSGSFETGIETSL